MHQQQHYTLFKIKKVKSQSTPPLIYMYRLGCIEGFYYGKILNNQDLANFKTGVI